MFPPGARVHKNHRAFLIGLTHSYSYHFTVFMLYCFQQVLFWIILGRIIVNVKNICHLLYSKILKIYMLTKNGELYAGK